MKTRHERLKRFSLALRSDVSRNTLGFQLRLHALAYQTVIIRTGFALGILIPAGARQ